MGERSKPIKRARALRKRLTPWEARAWVYLRQWRREGLHFRRQAPIGPYFVDFVCHEAKLIIELDGSGHASDRQAGYDRDRDAWLRQQGYEVIRLWNFALDEDWISTLDHIHNRARARLKQR